MRLLRIFGAEVAEPGSQGRLRVYNSLEGIVWLTVEVSQRMIMGIVPPH